MNILRCLREAYSIEQDGQKPDEDRVMATCVVTLYNGLIKTYYWSTRQKKHQIRDREDKNLNIEVFCILIKFLNQVVLLTTREAIISCALLHCCEKRCPFQTTHSNYPFKLIPTTFVLTSDVSENFRQIVDILTTLWFTLIGQTKSHDENIHGDVTNHRPSVPKNVCSELLLVLLSILQSGVR